MSGFLTLLWRELRRRSLLIGTGAALGFFVAIVPWLPGMGRHDPAELRAAGALGLALLWALTLAFFEGLGFLARDLGEGRLAFDFRLPAGATAIWAARALGALGAAAASTGLVLLPSALAGAELGVASEGLGQSLDSLLVVRLPALSLVFPVALALVLVLAHSAALARTTRSPWIAVDLLCALVFVALSLRALAPLDLWGAREELGRALLRLGAIAVAALAGATWVQTARGRSEPDRAHRPFSTAVAALALLPVLAVEARSHWYVSPSLEDMPLWQDEAWKLATDHRPGWITESRTLSSEWEQVWGYATGREAIRFRFVRQPKTGRSIPLGPSVGLLAPASAAAVSANGSTLAWLEAGLVRGDYAEARLVWLDLRATAATTNRVSLTWPHTPSAWALSPDGRRIATYWPQKSVGSGTRQLQIEDRDEGRLVMAVRIQDCRTARPLEYLDELTLRVHCMVTPETRDDLWVREFWDVDVTTGSATRQKTARR